MRSSHCGTTGLAVSLECWDAGSIPGPAQGVKDLALLQLRYTSQLWVGSDPWPGNSICCRIKTKNEYKELPHQPSNFSPERCSAVHSTAQSLNLNVITLKNSPRPKYISSQLAARKERVFLVTGKP